MPPHDASAARVVIATSNPHKVDELRRLFAGVRATLLSLSEAGEERRVSPHEPEESGGTFEANATIKAISYAAQLGLPCLADDSGLEVDALGGRPGVISSHYCTDGREAGLTRVQRDALNNARVLRELQGVPVDARSARFVCVMVLAAPGPGGGEGPRVIGSARGTCEGRIGLPDDPRAHVPRGDGGFGYDPLFLVGPDFLRTGAELTPDEKNACSHRGAAARAMARTLGAWVG
ncbi:MAG: non-canonical purine NTP pyrophosphatase [Phycisphaerales bacterium]|nr:non-canonical purine NTP pyrophosphatase [Phycisphaerales bacterium]